MLLLISGFLKGLCVGMKAYGKHERTREQPEAQVWESIDLQNMKTNLTWEFDVQQKWSMHCI